MSSSWLEEDQQRGTTTTRNTVGNAGGDASDSFIRRHAGKINLTVRIFNFGVACISAAASVYGILSIKEGSVALFCGFIHVDLCGHSWCLRVDAVYAGGENSRPVSMEFWVFL